jgi:protein transport protein SEC13
VCDTNGKIEISTIESNKIVHQEDIKKAHTGSIWQLAWSHPVDGNVLASCGFDQRIRLWQRQADGWNQIQEFIDEEGSVNTIAWAPREYGLVLVSGNACGTITMYK